MPMRDTLLAALTIVMFGAGATAIALCIWTLHGAQQHANNPKDMNSLWRVMTGRYRLHLIACTVLFGVCIVLMIVGNVVLRQPA
jgi:hypothetical protein